MNTVEFAPSGKAEPYLPVASPSCAAANEVTNAEDATLVHRADREVFEALFLQYKDKIFSYQFSLVRDIEDARDLTQKTFLKAWEKLPTLQDKSRFLPWLYKIARNVAYDYWRSKKKVLLYPWENITEQQTIISIAGPEEAVGVAELVRLALAALTPKYRDCLLLHIYGFSPQEIAKLVGIGKESVPTYLCYARSQFRQVYLRLNRECCTAEFR
jgi:RNA polymerase sigma-70 factor (ECF subfamily)